MTMPSGSLSETRALVDVTEGGGLGGLGISPWALGEPFPLPMSIRSTGPLLHGPMVARCAASAARGAVVWSRRGCLVGSPFSAIRGARLDASCFRRVTRFRLFLDCGFAIDEVNFFLALLRRMFPHIKHNFIFKVRLRVVIKAGVRTDTTFWCSKQISRIRPSCVYTSHSVSLKNTMFFLPLDNRPQVRKRGPSRIRTGVAGR